MTEASGRDEYVHKTELLYIWYEHSTVNQLYFSKKTDMQNETKYVPFKARVCCFY